MRADSRRQLIELHKTPTGRTRTHTAAPLHAIEAAYIGPTAWRSSRSCIPARKKSGAWTSSKSAQDSRRASPSELRTTRAARITPRNAIRQQKTSASCRTLAVDIP